MIGIAFGYPEPIGGVYFSPKDEIQFARIETGPVVAVSGRNIGPYYWRKWELPLEERTELADKILEEVGHRPRELSGFTLFWQSSVYTKADGTKTDGPGFQMSVRRKGEDGWDVRIIPEEEAMRVFALLRNIGHPDGPWELTDQMRADARDNFIVPQSAVEGWPKKEPPQELEYFDQEEPAGLTALLARAESLVDALSDQVATLVAGEP